MPSLRAGGSAVKGWVIKATGREMFFSEIRKKFKRPPFEADALEAKPSQPVRATQMMLGELARRKKAKA